MCSALSSLAAESPTASPDAFGTPDVRALLAAAMADLQIAKQRAAALLAQPPAGPPMEVAEVPPLAAVVASQPGAAFTAVADGLQQLEPTAAVAGAASAATAGLQHSTPAAAEDEAIEGDEQPAAAALVLLGADAVQLPAAADLTGAAMADVCTLATWLPKCTASILFLHLMCSNLSSVL